MPMIANPSCLKTWLSAFVLNAAFDHDKNAASMHGVVGHGDTCVADGVKILTKRLGHGHVNHYPVGLGTWIVKKARGRRFEFDRTIGPV